MTFSTCRLVSIWALGVMVLTTVACSQTRPQPTASSPAPPSSQVPSSPAPSASVPDRPRIVYAERKRATATVDAIDASQRTVTLKRADGKTFTLRVPKEARNFDQVEVGDTVAAEYLEAIAITVRRADAPPQATESAAIGLAAKGERPAGMIVNTTQMTARVEGVDLTARTVTLRGPQGGVRTITVDDSVRRLDEIKPGDEVVVHYTEAVALAIVR
jgi:hypothetical protein